MVPVELDVRDQEPCNRSQRLADRVRFGGEIVLEAADHPDPGRVEKNHEPDASISHGGVERKRTTSGTPEQVPTDEVLTCFVGGKTVAFGDVIVTQAP